MDFGESLSKISKSLPDAKSRGRHIKAMTVVGDADFQQLVFE